MPGFGRRHSARPRVSDYVVETETDFELFQGQIREVTHAGPLHGEQISQVNFVLTAYVAPGHGVDLFLLTRQDADNNFASDICIRKNGIDPDTDDRYLEELAFEIKSTQSTEDLEQRARIMAARGVRRIFAIPVRGDDAGSEIIAGPLAEWIPAEERWRTYRDDELIEDPCLLGPLPVRALLDAVEADNAVAQALLDKGNRVLLRHTEAAREEGRKEEGRKEGEENAAREYIHMFMHARGVVMDAATHARIAACSDLAVLKRWVMRAAQVTSASDLFDED